jgi:carbonic anhydrase
MIKTTTTELTPAPGHGDTTPFELTGRGQPGAGSLEIALARNRAFAAARGHEGAVVVPHLRLFVVTCLDPRVDLAHVLGLQLSDAIVVRNVGGRVTPEVIADVAFISQIFENLRPDGPVFEVAVIHHTQCGAVALADDTFRSRDAQRIGAEESTLRKQAILDPRPRSHTTSSACAPRTPSHRASPCPGTSTTSSAAWCRRSFRPASRQTEAPNNPSEPKETDNHDNRR